MRSARSTISSSGAASKATAAHGPARPTSWWPWSGGGARLEHHVGAEPDLRGRLARAVEQRHRSLQSTAGLNEDVFDALVLLAAGTDTPQAIGTGWQYVQQLQREMAEARQARLARLGFSTGEAETLASLHTRNFM